MMKIIIAGAGAMGSRFGIMLHRGGNDVTLVDGWPAHVEAIGQNGLKANFNGEDITEQIPVMLPSEVKGDTKADLIILFTKSMQLAEMLQDVKPLIAENTKILCLLNGIGHEDTIEKYIPMENIFIGNTMWTAGLVGPGEVKLFGNGSVELQNLGQNQEDAAKDLAKVLSESGLNAKYSDNIHYSIYRKACVNGTMNCLCSILDVNMAEFGATKPAHDIVVTVVNEFAAVAKHEGVDLDVDEVVAHVESCFDPETIGKHYPSMYQDLIKNNRLTEIDYINGAVSRKGKKYQIPTPYCDLLTQLIHCKEDILGAK
ncbi:panE protein [Companilactobacillus paralimentarius DSM 13238 = JCM 10415]|jgi:2-dehydropantoate 2-reductase|uniref:2-dehydropantoate 2-reductase n=2 Tax=Companilactobacillus paralimentarius TaxID=83526 RepID=A0A0R1PGE2_9LACO|nr:panE protein [Companilactobacillus paralimentarius DSM 13238 = JCM 10415]